MTNRATRDLLPHGCISAGTLRSLADALIRLERWHRALSGNGSDRPCLRRIESEGDVVKAYVSVGPSIGGHIECLTLTDGVWTLS